MAWTAANIPDLSGKIIVITGGTSGLGFETALDHRVQGREEGRGCPATHPDCTPGRQPAGDVPRPRESRFDPRFLSGLS
jgi:hypothetical protein